MLRGYLTARPQLFRGAQFFSTQAAASKGIIDEQLRYGAHMYKQIPVACVKGERIYLYDAEGKQYHDFLSGISTNNQGHCHPRLVKKMKE